MKRLITLFLCAVMVLALAACSGGSESSSSGANTSGEKDKEEKITLRIAWWGSEPRHNYTSEILKLYEEQNPNVKIESEYASWDDYWKKLAPSAAANELPDIIQMDLSYFSQYAENNQLEDLTPFIGNQIDTSDYNDNIISGGKLGDQLFGFNAGVNVVGFHYDPALLKKAGVDSIKDDWTWDDLKEIAAKAKDAGLYLDSSMQPDVFFNYYLRTLGKSLYSNDGSTLGYDDDQLFIDFFTMLSEMVEKGYSPTPDYIAQLKGIEDEPVVKEEAIGIWQWSNQFVGLQQVADRPMEMHAMPGPGTKEGLFMKPSMFWSMASNSKHKEEAAKLIDFLVNDIEANKLMLGDRGVPGSSVVKEELKPLLSPAQVQVFEFVEAAEQNSSPFNGPDPVGAGQVIELLDNLSEQMNFGQLKPEEAAKEFRQQADSILSQNK
ncbi:sugar ABC transporter substrate-binding protein [Bacillus sp. FJAT-50079]|uniref:ABC transporter substrate-binding protein n=1 Tax=Bacillus sp. FJAT-50079 TaxID=2833577 RepID=UPI001BC948B4|nr:sugar ABC transporter substrate-binding protein [Bacillus sp. FJAT-50079]MBS4208342.1 sugar ABC transporter substrate-binding protein [Bacillus sp. FJAT-50079]